MTVKEFVYSRTGDRIFATWHAVLLGLMIYGFIKAIPFVHGLAFAGLCILLIQGGCSQLVAILKMLTGVSTDRLEARMKEYSAAIRRGETNVG